MKTNITFSGIISVFLVLSLASFLSAAELAPKEVYELKQKAVEKLDYQEFCKYVTSDNLRGFKNADDPRQLLYLIKVTKSPVEYQIIREDIKGNEAFVYLKGRAPNPKSGGGVEQGFGKAVFKKEGSAWKYHQEEWQKDAWK